MRANHIIIRVGILFIAVLCCISVAAQSTRTDSIGESESPNTQNRQVAEYQYLAIFVWLKFPTFSRVSYLCPPLFVVSCSLPPKKPNRGFSQNVGQCIDCPKILVNDIGAEGIVLFG